MSSPPRSAVASIAVCSAAAVACWILAVLGDPGSWRVIAIVAALLFTGLTFLGVLGFAKRRGS